MKILISLSGGLDSAVVLAQTKLSFPDDQTEAVLFTYGSKHNALENKAAINLCHHYGISHRIIDISSVMGAFKSDLLMSGGKIPEGHYHEENMRDTVVPGRNMIFISILAGLAESMYDGIPVMVNIGVHAGDHHIYPDCREAFLKAVGSAVTLGTEGRVLIRAPLVFHDKAAIVSMGLSANIPFHLTRTCYTSDPVACGRCGSCQERLEAFALNNVSDPLEYQSREILPKGVK